MFGLNFLFRCFVILLVFVTSAVVFEYRFKKYKALDPCKQLDYLKSSDFEGFDNVTGAPNGCKIVPNIVHLVKFNQRMFNFAHTVCLLSVLKNQNPDRIIIHTNVNNFSGRNWDILVSTPGFQERLIIKQRSMPEEIFAKKTFFKTYHASDITRIRVLMEYGGIYVDNDSCIIRNLDEFRRYEMTLGWMPGKSMGNMAMVAHKNARFLREWLETYKTNYKPRKFYYNAGDYPTAAILKKNPSLVHRVEELFGNYGILRKLYLRPFPEWKNYYILHTLSNHIRQLKNESLKLFPKNLVLPDSFTELNVMNYPVAYRDLVMSVWPIPFSNSTNVTAFNVTEFNKFNNR